MSLIELITKKIVILTAFSHLFLVGGAVYWLFLRKEYPMIGRFFAKRGIWLAFLVSLVATAGSLFYSNIIGFPPCELCWYQRVFMYPLVILFGAALLKKDRAVVDYGLAISVAGFAITAYHNVMYYNLGGLNAICDFGGVGVSCIKRYVYELGYITIPLMSLTAFALIIAFLLFIKYLPKNK